MSNTRLSSLKQHTVDIAQMLEFRSPRHISWAAVFLKLNETRDPGHSERPCPCPAQRCLGKGVASFEETVGTLGLCS